MHIIFPQKCAFCGKILFPQKVDVEFCDLCLSEIEFFEKDFVDAKEIDSPFFDGVISVCRYRGLIVEVIHRFKFNAKPVYYRPLAKFLYMKLEGISEVVDADFVMAVPMFVSKQKERGYNQAALIAKGFASCSGLPDYSKFLTRTRKTKKQSTLTKTERAENVKNSFAIWPPHFDLSGKTIILIDDIFTTGNTLNECARILKIAGAKFVYCAVVATGAN
jgi:ComF family protein